MLLSLSVNVTAPPDDDLAQPSGTLTVNVAPAGRYFTKAWLSGMSPGGLTSVAAGDGALDAGGLVEGVPPPGAVDVEPAVLGELSDPFTAGLPDELPPQPARTGTTTSAATADTAIPLAIRVRIADLHQVLSRRRASYLRR
jgi:hypothetical protein